jgi:isoleucyl-tRNA synthetase
VEVTPELAAEGMVRDVARGVNEIRRERGLHVSDRIHLVIDPGHHDDLRQAIEDHQGFLKDETLAVELLVDGPVSDGHRAQLADGRAYHVGLHVVH